MKDYLGALFLQLLSCIAPSFYLFFILSYKIKFSTKNKIKLKKSFEDQIQRQKTI